MMNIRKYSVLVALMMIVTCGQSAASRFEENEKPGDKSLPSDILSYGKHRFRIPSQFLLYLGRVDGVALVVAKSVGLSGTSSPTKAEASASLP